jgi:hypothetical protein
MNGDVLGAGNAGKILHKFSKGQLRSNRQEKQIVEALSKWRSAADVASTAIPISAPGQRPAQNFRPPSLAPPNLSRSLSILTPPLIDDATEMVVSVSMSCVCCCQDTQQECTHRAGWLMMLMVSLMGPAVTAQKPCRMLPIPRRATASRNHLLRPPVVVAWKCWRKCCTPTPIVKWCR